MRWRVKNVFVPSLFVAHLPRRLMAERGTGNIGRSAMKYVVLPGAIALALLLSITCTNKASTQEFTDANFLTSGLARIDLLSPTENQQVSTATPTLSWSSRAVNLYTIELAADSNFAHILLRRDISGTSYTIANSDLIGISSLSTATYHWRVRVAKIADNLLSKAGTFFLVAIPAGGSGHAGTIYVNANGSNAVQNGSISLPYKLIQPGIEAADSLRSSNGNITFEIRVAQGTYNEEVNMKPGISIKGGYKSADWTRDPRINTTTIIGQADSGVRANADITLAHRSSTIIDGFFIQAGNAATVTRGVANFGGSPTISNNIISGGTGTQNAFGVYATGGAQPLITNNIIMGATGTGSNYGVFCFDTGTNVLIWGNTISGGVTGSAGPTAVHFRTGATGSLKNNILFNNSGTGNCIGEQDSISSPTEVLNNNLFNCATLYFDQGANNVTLMTTALTGPSGSLTSFGNINISNTGNQLFVDIDGPDNNLATIADNDWHLTTAFPGICNVRFGGLDLSGSFAADLDGMIRTASIASLPCTLTAPSNTAGQGWSIGAFESN